MTTLFFARQESRRLDVVFEQRTAQQPHPGTRYMGTEASNPLTAMRQALLLACLNQAAIANLRAMFGLSPNGQQPMSQLAAMAAIPSLIGAFGVGSNKRPNWDAFERTLDALYDGNSETAAGGQYPMVGPIQQQIVSPTIRVKNKVVNNHTTNNTTNNTNNIHNDNSRNATINGSPGASVDNSSTGRDRAGGDITNIGRDQVGGNNTTVGRDQVGGHSVRGRGNTTGDGNAVAGSGGNAASGSASTAGDGNRAGSGNANGGSGRVYGDGSNDLSGSRISGSAIIGDQNKVKIKKVKPPKVESQSPGYNPPRSNN